MGDGYAVRFCTASPYFTYERSSEVCPDTNSYLLLVKMKENKKTWKLVNFCEFDPYAIKSYCAIHNVDENLNLGDITKVDETKHSRSI